MKNNVDKNKKILFDIFKSVGVYIDENNFNEKIEMDSLQFVNVIIQIEQEFMIRITEDYYNYEELVTFNDYINLINRFIM